jgi:glutaryl-CoA dehydrogenase
VTVAAASSTRVKEFVPPPINGDFYRIADLFEPKERAVAKRLRDFMEIEVGPIIEDYWEKGPISSRDHSRVGRAGRPHRRGRLRWIWRSRWKLAVEQRPRHGTGAHRLVHRNLRERPHMPSAGSIYLCGDEGQKARRLLPMMRWDKTGSFGLTELFVASATFGGMLTTCPREGDEWILNGQKKWIGNSTCSDINVIRARDEASGQVKGFVVEKEKPGFLVEKIETKMALRVVQNGLITLKDCRTPAADRLQNANSFKDCGKVLRMTRTGVAWFAVGGAMDAYGLALRHAVERKQFGRPIGGFPLVQDLLVRMLGNVTACQAMRLRLAQLRTNG